MRLPIQVDTVDEAVAIILQTLREFQAQSADARQGKS
jgi:hypothetical protein